MMYQNKLNAINNWARTDSWKIILGVFYSYLARYLTYSFRQQIKHSWIEVLENHGFDVDYEIDMNNILNDMNENRKINILSLTVKGVPESPHIIQNLSIIAVKPSRVTVIIDSDYGFVDYLKKYYETHDKHSKVSVINSDEKEQTRMVLT